MRSYCIGRCGCNAHRLLTTLSGEEAAAARGWWDPNDEGLCIWAAYQPKGAANLAASYLDLSGNGNNTGPGVAPTWDVVNGWKFNGTTQYLVTTFVPQNDQSQSMLVQYTTATIGGALIGQRENGDQYNIIYNPAGPDMRYQNGQASGNVNPDLAAGNVGVGGSRAYRNGIDEGVALAVYAGGAPVRPIYIGARNRGGPVGYCAFYCQAVAIYDCTLTAPQVLAVATAMAAL